MCIIRQKTVECWLMSWNSLRFAPQLISLWTIFRYNQVRRYDSESCYFRLEPELWRFTWTVKIKDSNFCIYECWLDKMLMWDYFHHCTSHNSQQTIKKYSLKNQIASFNTISKSHMMLMAMFPFNAQNRNITWNPSYAVTGSMQKRYARFARIDS